MAKKPKKADAPEGEASESEPKPAGSKKLVILVAVALVVGGAGTGGYFFFAPKKPEAAEVQKPKTTAYVDMREMTINLGSEPNQDARRVLKFKAALEVPDARTATEIQPALPRVEDAVQGFLREMRASELEGSAGAYYLREELLRRVNAAVHPLKVDAVLLRDMLIQ